MNGASQYICGVFDSLSLEERATWSGSWRITNDDGITKIFGADTDEQSGVPVDGDTVLKYAAVWRAVSLISSSVAKLPLYVYRREGEGKERAKEHPAYRRLRRKPNDYQTAYTFWQTLMAHVLLRGNGYAFISRNQGNGQVDALWLLDPDETWPVRENGKLYYTTTVVSGGERKTRILGADEVLHIKGLSYDGLVGYSVISYGAETFGRGLGAARYASRFFKNSAVPSIIVEVPGQMKPDAQERFLEQWNARQGGLDNAHSAAILTNAASVKPITIPAKDAQLLEMREFEIKDIANLFGIPPHKLGDSSRTAYNSLEQEQRAFLDECLDAWLVNIETECFDKLLTEKQKRTDSHTIEYLRSALVRADIKTRYETYSTGRAIGILSANECRAKENMNPIDGGDSYDNPNITPGQADDSELSEAENGADSDDGDGAESA